MQLEDRIAELAKKYLPLAEEWLKEAIRIPIDTIAENPNVGMSNGEEPRLQYLKSQIIKHKCVFNPEDVFFDEFGDLVWYVEDKEDSIPSAEKKVIYFDGHTDTVNPLQEQWHKTLGDGIDPFLGLTDPSKCCYETLKQNIGWCPKKEQWKNVIWGRGSADQLAGVISQMMATKICIELKSEGALHGVIIRSVGTVCEEDNDGAGPLYYIRKNIPGKGPEFVPDVIVITEGTGDSTRSALGIYRGQRGRMQIEVEVIGLSAHGSMPHKGLNPLEWGAKILTQATEQAEKPDAFLDHPFLGKGTRTASWCQLDTPSDCAVPQRFVFRFDRRMTVGETPDACLAAIADLPACEEARKAGLTVNVRVPTYDKDSWKGYCPHNQQIYMGWETPEDHPAIKAAVNAYSGSVGKHITDEELADMDGYLRKEPFVGRWIFSTDGVGVPLPVDQDLFKVPESKKWISQGGYTYPAMVGLGAGTEQNTHKIGECIHRIELEKACAWLARFPSSYVEACK